MKSTEYSDDLKEIVRASTHDFLNSFMNVTDINFTVQKQHLLEDLKIIENE